MGKGLSVGTSSPSGCGDTPTDASWRSADRRETIAPFRIGFTAPASRFQRPFRRRCAVLSTAATSICRLDLTDTPSLTRILGTFQPNVVIHLAAALRDEPLERLLAVNVNGVASLLSAIAGAGVTPQAIVLGSSGAVYGIPSELPISEEARCAPVDPYGVSKQAGEAVGRLVAGQHALAVIVARIFNPVGPGQDERHLTSSVAMQATEVAAGRRPQIEVGPLDTTRDFIDVRDAAAALVLLSEKGVPGTTYNVASGIETHTADVLTAALRAAGVRADVPIDRSPRAPERHSTPRGGYQTAPGARLSRGPPARHEPGRRGALLPRGGRERRRRGSTFSPRARRHRDRDPSILRSRSTPACCRRCPIGWRRSFPARIW